MLLSNYRNPPYKSPMTMTPRSPPQGSQSPKRKRSDHDEAGEGGTSSLKLETVLLRREETEVPDSPRTKVAVTFEGLSVRAGSERSPRKKIKVDGISPCTPRARNEDPEIPDSTEPPRPPPPSSQASPLQSRSLSPSPSPSPSPDQQYWSLSEITGHDIDPAFPDDDGYGINGIGFKPTPQMADARRQKRKQQVSEWKAREAREARQRRLERRKGVEVEGREGKGRVVRFKDGGDGEGS